MAGPHVLTIVIPALNEEDAIGDTLRRWLEARAHIARESPVRRGRGPGRERRIERPHRGDRAGLPDVTVLAFERNRGYGAAIKTGWEHARGDLLGFLDADGTCDPAVFVGLCRAVGSSADLALGRAWARTARCRSCARWATALRLDARRAQRRVVQDTASGMRVVRRAALEASTRCRTACTSRRP